MEFQLLGALVVGFFFYCLSLFSKKREERLSLKIQELEEKLQVAENRRISFQVALYGNDHNLYLATVYIDRHGVAYAPEEENERKLIHMDVFKDADMCRRLLGAAHWSKLNVPERFEVSMLGRVYRTEY